MKTKIFKKLFFSFLTSFILFSIFIGLIFAFLFARYNMDTHKKEMEQVGKNISLFLTQNLNAENQIAEMGTMEDHSNEMRRNQGKSQGSGKGMGKNLKNFLVLAEDSSLYEIWVLDKNLNQFTFGKHEKNVNIDEIPKDADGILLKSLEGQSVFSERFSTLLDNPSITYATPIMDHNNTIIGSVLLHSQLSYIEDITKAGILILSASMFIGIVISLVIAGLFSARFVKPLNQMKRVAQGISQGDFDIKTEINQKDEIGELALTIDEMSHKLWLASIESEKLENIRREFVANISHELRTPITVLRGSLEAILDGIITEEDKVKEYHVQMLSEAVYLERLVNDLLDLGKLQSPDFQIEKSLVDLRIVVEDTRRSLQKIAMKENITIHLEIIGDNFDFYGDYDRLRQMIVIILDNAIKFSHPNGRVDLILEEKGSISLSIIDYGIGIEDDLVNHIFDRFYKQRSEVNKKGTGLGLVIAKQIAERHDIQIEVVNEEKFTKFILKF